MEQLTKGTEKQVNREVEKIELAISWENINNRNFDLLELIRVKKTDRVLEIQEWVKNNNQLMDKIRKEILELEVEG